MSEESSEHGEAFYECAKLKEELRTMLEQRLTEEIFEVLDKVIDYAFSLGKAEAMDDITNRLDNIKQQTSLPENPFNN